MYHVRGIGYFIQGEQIEDICYRVLQHSVAFNPACIALHRDVHLAPLFAHLLEIGINVFLRLLLLPTVDRNPPTSLYSAIDGIPESSSP